MILLVCVGFGSASGAQHSQAYSTEICTPSPKYEITSSDNLWTVFSRSHHAYDIWILNKKTRQCRFLLECPSTVSVGWAPDSKHFFVNDHKASDEEYAFVYDALTLKVIDISKLLVTADPRVVKFLNAGHHYVVVQRWMTPYDLLVWVRGHFDDYPAYEFALQYQVNLSGAVSKLSQRMWLPQ